MPVLVVAIELLMWLFSLSLPLGGSRYLFTFHIALHTYYPWLSFISVHCAAQRFLLRTETRSKGLRSKCIGRYAPLPFVSISVFLFMAGHWRRGVYIVCMLKSSVSIYVTSVDISLSLPSFILLFLPMAPSMCWPALTVIRGSGIDQMVFSLWAETT